MLRYTLLRTLIFFGCLGVAWLAGLRGQENLIPLVLVAAIGSMIISFVALRPFREQYSAEIAEKLQARAEAKRAGVGVVDGRHDDGASGDGHHGTHGTMGTITSDAAAEDAEIGRADTDPPQYR